MKRLSIITAGLLALALAGCDSMPSMPWGGWTTLIDGEKGLENFNRAGDVNWRAEGGAIVGDKGKGGHLVSKNSYKDFQLKVEFWADHTTNSGIYMRCQDRNKITDKSCYEANIYDQRGDPSYGTGGIVHIAKIQGPMVKAGGKWNTYDITVKGSQITVVLNGTQTASAQHSAFKEGPIALQFGNRPPKGDPGGAIKFRKVEIKPL